MVFEAGMAGVYLGVSGAVPLMSTVDQALPVTPTWLHAAPFANQLPPSRGFFHALQSDCCAS